MKIRKVEYVYHFSGGEEKVAILHQPVLIKVRYLAITNTGGGDGGSELSGRWKFEIIFCKKLRKRLLT